METNLKVEVFKDELVVVRPDASVVVVTLNDSINISKDIVTAIVNNVPVVHELHTLLNDRNALVDNLKRELKRANEKVVDVETRLGDAMTELANRDIVAEDKLKVAIEGFIAVADGTKVYNLDHELICDCGQSWKAIAVVKALKNGQIDVDTVKLVYPDRPKKRVEGVLGD